MRHSYELSTQTLKVLTDRTESIAKEMDINPTNLRQVLNGRETDPFAKFRHWFTGAVRAGAPIEHWTTELQIIVARYTRNAPITENPAVLTADIGREFSEFIEAELLNKSFESQISELNDVIRAAEQKKSDLINAKNAAHFGENAISFDTRNAVKQRMSGGQR